jgi:SulP family sulfate permease
VATQNRSIAHGLASIAPWRRGYDRAWLSRDVIAGLAAGAVVIPQAMAYATVANLPVQVGLYTCMVPMAVYALLGGSRTLSVSTTSTIAILTASTLVAADVAAGSSDPARALAGLTLLVGVILLAARLLSLGVLIDNISEATLIGIKVGVGLTVAAGQLPKVLGIPGNPSADNFFSEMRAVFDQLGRASSTTIAFSAVTLAVLLGLRRMAPRIPGPLVAVAGGILLVAVTSIDAHGLAVIARVPSGLPSPVAPSFDHVGALLPGAFAIAIMVFLETLAVARSVRRPSEPPIDNNQELVASGFACVAGAFFRAMPSAGGFSQTAINQRSGARTQLSELVTVVLAVACALFLGSVLSDLPQATLGCMVILAVLGLISPAEFVQFWRLSRLEFWVAAVTAASGLVFGLLPAVLIGVFLTLLLVLVELDRVGVTELQPTVGDHDVEVAGAETVPVPGLRILRFDGPLYTANVRSANRKVVAAVDRSEGTSVVVLDGTALARVSLTVVHQFADLEQEMLDRGVTLWIVALPPATLQMARQTPRWQELAGASRLFPTALAAVSAFREQSAGVPVGS